MQPLDLEALTRDAIDAGDPDEIQRLGALVDAEQDKSRRPRPSLLASALWYASTGLHVFPLQPGQKVPRRGSNGCKDATADEAKIRAWWKADPASNIGIATGHIVDVIDVDGPIGVVSWARMASLPPIVGRVSTPRPGGNHLYIQASGRGNRAGIAPGVDYRGLGGYVVAPPSVNADGTAYLWTMPLDVEAAAGAA